MTDVQLRHEPQQARAQGTLEQLRTAARDLYNDPEIGRDRITLGMVQQRADVSIGTVYRYWENRIAMLDDIAPDRDQSPIVAPAPEQVEGEVEA